MDKTKHFMCDCGDPWHGLEISVDMDFEDAVPVVCTIVNENMRWADRLKAIWSILRGRLHVLHEVYISRDEINDFVDFVASIKHNPSPTVYAGGGIRFGRDENGNPKWVNGDGY